jgi:hypothetical protein
MAGLDDIGGTHNKLSGVLVIDLTPDAELNVRSEMVHVEGINSAIHAEAIGWADDRISLDVED